MSADGPRLRPTSPQGPLRLEASGEGTPSADAAEASYPIIDWLQGDDRNGGSDVSEDVNVDEVSVSITPTERMRNRLLEWTVVHCERFEKKVYFRELLGQVVHSFLGPLGYPLLRLYYGSLLALENRFMTLVPGRGQRSDKKLLPLICITNILNHLTGFNFTLAVFLHLYFQSESSSAAEIVVAVIAVFMRCNSIAIKYAHFPLPAYRQFDSDELSSKRLMDGLIIMSWSLPKPELVRDLVDVSMLTVVGPEPDVSLLKFLPWPETMREAQKIARRQGVTSRSIVSHVLLQGQLTASKCPRSHKSASHVLDLRLELPPGMRSRMMSGEDPVDLDIEGGADEMATPRGATVEVQELFTQLVEAVVRAEGRSLVMHRLQYQICLSINATIVMLPCMGRVLAGQPIFGSTWHIWLQVILCAPATWNNSGSCVLFLWIGIRDMHRRLMLTRSLAALLSARASDRKTLPKLPPEVRDLGILDLRDIHTVEAFRELHGLCKNFGQSFGVRITSFMNAFATVTLCMMAYVLVLIEFEMHNLLDRTTLLISLWGVMILGCSIVALAMLGEAVNTTQDRIVYLLNKHAMELQAESIRGSAGREPDAGAPPGITEYLFSVANDLAQEQAASPVKLLGMYCGISLLSALYAIPAVWLSRLGNFCWDNPSLCKPAWWT